MAILETKCNIPRVGRFEKISKSVFDNSLKDAPRSEVDVLNDIYNNKFEEYKPVRSTYGSAGYDFKAWTDFMIPKHGSLVIPTFIKCRITNGWVLCMFPRSGMGFKYGIRLANTVGIIDSDYYGCESNDGHIMVKLINPTDENIIICSGDKFCQGVFLPFGITDDDEPLSGSRNGGMGSTGK